MVGCWFSPRGRIGRARYWWAYLIPLGGTQFLLGFLSLLVMTTFAGSQLLRLLDLHQDPFMVPLSPTEQEALMRQSLLELERGAEWVWWCQLGILALMMPMLAGAAKRWRDAGQSGWWALLLLIPGLGFLVAIFLGCLRGRPDAAA